MIEIKRKSAKFQKIGRYVFGLEKISLRNIKNLIENHNPRKVLIIGSGEIGAGCDLIYMRKNIEIVGIDIYPSPTVTFICDAHNLIFEDGSFDFVVCQAVLEHVQEPQQVVNEIFRVLKPGGIVYSEIPFMQAVHEYPYDYTRYTKEGHRRLYLSFEVLEVGINGGYLNASAWTFRYFILSLLKNKAVAILVSAPFFIIAKILENIIHCENDLLYTGTFVCAKK